MDPTRFDDLATRLSHGLSRRQGLGLLAALGVSAGLLAEDAEARKGKKRKKGKGKKGKGNKGVQCTPEPQATTCARGCGTLTNNCNQTVICSCPTLGDSCLPNGTCARACTSTTQCVDLGCAPQPSACSAASAEGPKYCVDSNRSCSTLQSCGPQASTSNCPQGFACLADCQPAGGPRCYPVSVCPPAP